MKALADLKFEETTPIQEQTLLPVLEGKDIAGLAQTGTGKTGAFLIPLVDRVLRSREKFLETQKAVEASREEPVEADETSEASEQIETPSEEADQGSDESVSDNTFAPRPLFQDWQPRNFILVLVPTRELAEQVQVNTQMLTKHTELRSVSVYGGTSYEKQKAAFEKGVEFVIATPGRLIDLYKEHVVDLKQVRAVVFDEADRMFDMGFKDDMKYILRRIPQDRQFLVFSATLNFDVLNVAYEMGADPVEINVSRDRATAEHVKDEIFHIGQDEKAAYLLSILRKASPRQAIVFSNFKRNVERIAVFLNRNKIPAVGISSLLTQSQRNRVMEQFKGESEQNILVATDVAARGLDILGVDLVINFELPDDPENYVHRIGRTGRAGQEGTAYSLVSDRDVDALARIQDYVNRKIDTGWLEDEEIVKEFEAFPSERDVDPVRPKRPDKSGDRGGRRDRRPNRDRNQKAKGGGSQERDRKEARKDSGPRRDRKDSRRNRRPQQQHKKSASPAPQLNGQAEGRTEGTHRDRRTGRHGGPQPQASAASGKNTSSRDPRRYRKDQQRRRRYSGSRPQKTPPAAASTLGQKVSGFFKKLFG